MIGFDLARTFAPAVPARPASGIVNVGGFTASLLAVLGIGLVLDAVTPGASTDYSAGAYRLAMCVQYVGWLVGGVQVWRYRYRARGAPRGHPAADVPRHERARAVSAPAAALPVEGRVAAPRSFDDDLRGLIADVRVRCAPRGRRACPT